MRPLQKFTVDAFRDGLATTFTQSADPRDLRRLTWGLPAVLMSAFALLFFQHPSLLEYQRRRQKRTGLRIDSCVPQHPSRHTTQVSGAGAPAPVPPLEGKPSARALHWFRPVRSKSRQLDDRELLCSG